MEQQMIGHKLLPTLLFTAAIVPILYVALPLIHMGAGLSPTQVSHAIFNGQIDRAMGTSVAASAATTLIAAMFGLPTAYLLSLRNFWGKRIIESILLLPIILPPVVGGIGQLFLYGPMTPIGRFFAGYHIPLTNSVIGVVLAQLYITSPFMILAARAGFDEIPSELKEAMRVQGGGVWHIFWYVSLPLARSAVLAGAVLTFTRAMGEFGATMIMAYHPYTLPVDIWVQFTSGGLETIIPITAVVAVVAFASALLGTAWRRARD
jgi:molybdate/tungstate transport system permease protein